MTFKAGVVQITLLTHRKTPPATSPVTQAGVKAPNGKQKWTEVERNNSGEIAFDGRDLKPLNIIHKMIRCVHLRPVGVTHIPGEISSVVFISNYIWLQQKRPFFPLSCCCSPRLDGLLRTSLGSERLKVAYGCLICPGRHDYVQK